MDEIYQVEFDIKEQKGKTIQELFASIQLYRSEGKSLPSIYAAFKRSGLWSNSFSSFSKNYYRHRKLGKSAKTKRFKSTEPLISASPNSKQNLAAKGPQEKNIESKPQIDNRTGIKPDMTLEEKRAISAQIFRRKRGK